MRRVGARSVVRDELTRGVWCGGALMWWCGGVVWRVAIGVWRVA